MLTREKLPFNLAKEDQVLILTGMDWLDFEQLIGEEYLGYRASYRDGEITIVSPGRNHERICEIIRVLIVAYCHKYNKSYFPFGSTTLKNSPLVGKEPDTAFAFDVDKDVPDLAVEVIFSSGSLDDLEKYKILGIKEVWIWQNQELKFYQLGVNNYQEIELSFHLNKINSNVLIKYVNRGLSEDFLAIYKDFINGN